jgi:hypothetical protein
MAQSATRPANAGDGELEPVDLPARRGNRQVSALELLNGSASAHVHNRPSANKNGSIENVPLSTSTMPSSFMIAHVSPSGRPTHVQYVCWRRR